MIFSLNRQEEDAVIFFQRYAMIVQNI